MCWRVNSKACTFVKDKHPFMASFPGQPDQAGTRNVKPILDFDEGVAIASAAPCASHWYLAPDR